MRKPNVFNGSVINVTRLLQSAAAGGVLLAATSQVAAAPTLRVQVDQNGDFLMVGNTLGYDCSNSTPAPVVGSIGALCGSSQGDTSPDLFWRSQDPNGTSATADLTITPGQARSSAVLTIPSGGVVTHAFLYWAGENSGGDNTATLDRPGGFSSNVTATQGFSNGNYYQSVADVTTLVQTNGSGLYRVSGVAMKDFRNSNDDVNFGAWTLVVFYRRASEPPRNLALFDGLDLVSDGNPSSATLSGFLVPNAGFDAKLGVIAYEGDGSITGDSLLFGMAPLANSDRLTDGVNPIDNFFNSSRSRLGTAVSVAGDLPQTTGATGSLSGVDMDIVNITSRVTAGQTAADIRATSTGDQYYLGAFITSISTFKPDFSSSTKSVVDVNGGALRPGDELEYTIVVSNTGNDPSVRTVLNDVIPTGTTWVPGSISISAGPNNGAKTDAVDSDQGEFNNGTRTMTVRLGTGANGAQGGTLTVGQSTTVKFRVTVDANATGTLSNQASISFEGQQGAPPATQPTDGSSDPGSQPTDIPIDDCETDNDCPTATPACDTSASPNVCVECTDDSYCSGDTPNCDTASNTCVCLAGPGLCTDTDGDGLPDGVETTIGTDPNDADSDDDGVPDGAEVDPGVDTDGDGLINALDPDSDDDGLFDGTEMGRDCSNADTDFSAGHCRADADAGATTTDPLDADTDDGGATDGSEDFNLDGAIDAGETDPTSGHGSDDSGVTDTDGDGLSDGLETFLGSDPNDADTDDDGVIDGQENNPSDDTDGDGLINVLDVDSDNDALYDGTERGFDCEAMGTDKSLGHCIADADNTTTTSPLLWDTDGGTVSDGSEDFNRNGAVDSGETDPTLGHASDDASVTDTDGDGLSDGLETNIGTDPNDADSDDDGLLDGEEPNPADDHDGDGDINARDPDSDGDGLTDGLEAGRDCSNGATDISIGNCNADGDSGATTTGVLQRDTDRGGVSDGDEDTNKNGVVDTGERDPNDGSDDDTNPGTGGAGGTAGSAGSAGAAGSSSGGTSTGGSSSGGTSTGGTNTGGSSIGGTSAGGSSTGGSNGLGDDGFVLEGGGCGCAVPGGNSDKAPLGALALGALGLVTWRRRRKHSK